MKTENPERKTKKKKFKKKREPNTKKFES